MRVTVAIRKMMTTPFNIFNHFNYFGANKFPCNKALLSTFFFLKKKYIERISL
jgi:hypothetical protein